MLTIEDYTEKSFAIFGVQFEEEKVWLEKCGGLSNPVLLRKSTNKREAGILFNKMKFKRSDLESFIAHPLANKTLVDKPKVFTSKKVVTTDIVPQPTKILTSSVKEIETNDDTKTIIAGLLARIENLETEQAVQRKLINSLTTGKRPISVIETTKSRTTTNKKVKKQTDNEYGYDDEGAEEESESKPMFMSYMDEL